METLTIVITEASDEPGYFYDIYDASPETINNQAIESLDGGFCTSTMKNALGMATKQAKELLASKN